jgi:hypothetical protein
MTKSTSTIQLSLQFEDQYQERPQKYKRGFSSHISGLFEVLDENIVKHSQFNLDW